jgi:hypothetical protein
VLSEQASYPGIVTGLSAETLDEKSARHFRSRRGCRRTCRWSGTNRCDRREKAGHSGPDDRGCTPMSREKPGDDPRQRTDEKSTKQSNEPWKAPVERSKSLAARRRTWRSGTIRTRIEEDPQRALNEQAISRRVSDLGGRSHRHRGVCHSAISLLLARKSTAAKIARKAKGDSVRAARLIPKRLTALLFGLCRLSGHRPR